MTSNGMEDVSAAATADEGAEAGAAGDGDGDGEGSSDGDGGMLRSQQKRLNSALLHSADFKRRQCQRFFV